MDMEVRPEILRVERPPQSGQDRPRRQPQGGNSGGGGSLPLYDSSSLPAATVNPPLHDSVSISAAARVVAETDYAASHPPLSFPRLLLNTLLRRR